MTRAGGVSGFENYLAWNFHGALGSWRTPSVTLSFPQHGRRSSCDHVYGCQIVSRGVPRIVIVLGSPTLDAPWTSSPTRSSCRGARFVRSVATSSGRSDTTSPRSPCQPQATSTRPSPVSPCRCPASAWSPTRCSCGGSGLEPCEHSCRREGSRQRSFYPWWLQFVHSQPSHVQVSHAQSGPHFVHWQSPACAKEMSESVCVSVVMAYHYPVLHEGTLVTRGGQG